VSSHFSTLSSSHKLDVFKDFYLLTSANLTDTGGREKEKGRT